MNLSLTFNSVIKFMYISIDILIMIDFIVCGIHNLLDMVSNYTSRDPRVM